MAQESPDRLVHIPTSCLLIPAAGLAANTAPGTPRQANCRPGDQRSASLCFFRGAPGGAVSLALVAAAFGATWISDSLKKWFHSQFEDDAKCRITSSPIQRCLETTFLAPPLLFHRQQQTSPNHPKPLPQNRTRRLQFTVLTKQGHGHVPLLARNNEDLGFG